MKRKWRKMKCDNGIFTLEEYCDYGTVCTSNVRKIVKHKEKKRKKLLEEVDNLKLARELSERKGETSSQMLMR